MLHFHSFSGSGTLSRPGGSTGYGRVMRIDSVAAQQLVVFTQKKLEVGK
jgi:hypothetical protein